MSEQATFKPIKGSASDWDDDEREAGVRVLNEGNKAEITSLLVGHKVTKVDGEHLLLDNGTVIKAIGHDGGCACDAGCYNLSVLNGVDNIITRVSYDYRPASDDDDWDKETRPERASRRTPRTSGPATTGCSCSRTTSRST